MYLTFNTQLVLYKCMNQNLYFCFLSPGNYRSSAAQWVAVMRNQSLVFANTRMWDERRVTAWVAIAEEAQPGKHALWSNFQDNAPCSMTPRWVTNYKRASNFSKPVQAFWLWVPGRVADEIKELWSMVLRNCLLYKWPESVTLSSYSFPLDGHSISVSVMNPPLSFWLCGYFRFCLCSSFLSPLIHYVTTSTPKASNVIQSLDTQYFFSCSPDLSRCGFSTPKQRPSHSFQVDICNKLPNLICPKQTPGFNSSNLWFLPQTLSSNNGQLSSSCYSGQNNSWLFSFSHTPHVIPLANPEVLLSKYPKLRTLSPPLLLSLWSE